MKIRVTVEISGDKLSGMICTLNNCDRVPDNDSLLRLFSKHYHKSCKETLPPTAFIKNIEVL